MPVKGYFKGHGEEVMSDMMSRYGAKKGKSVFYATANKRKMIPSHGIPESTPELGKRVRGRGDGPADTIETDFANEEQQYKYQQEEDQPSRPAYERERDVANVYEERAKPRPGNPPFGPMTPGGKGMQAHVYEERSKPRPGQPPFGPMTPGGKIESHLKGSSETDTKRWKRGLMPVNMQCCKGM